jgi:hypothetical protein
MIVDQLRDSITLLPQFHLFLSPTPISFVDLQLASNGLKFGANESV